MQDLVEELQRAGVKLSKAAISKYENGATTPRAANLRALARVLDCSVEYLLNETEPEIEWVCFRKKAALTRRNEARVKEAAVQWLQVRLLVDGALGTASSSVELPNRRLEPGDFEGCETTADTLRADWRLGDWPIESLAVALERSGVIVIEVDSDDQFDGLSGVASGQIRFVVVTSGVPVDRLRMSLAHELGHIVIAPTADEKADEHLAYRFGAALLLPRSVVFERIGRKRQNVTLAELLLLKREYGLSVQATIRRCYDLGVVSEWEYRRLYIELRGRGWQRNEPENCGHFERPSRFQARLLRCISEGTISETEIRSLYPEVAAYLPLSDSDSEWKWADLHRRNPIEREAELRVAAESALADYGNDGSLSGLEFVEDAD